MAHDLRQALRLLRLNPGFTTLAILTLAIGIGACVTMFSVIYGVLLRPLPYPQPDRIVALWEVEKSGSTMRVGWPNFVDWHQQARTLDSIAAYEGGTTTVLGGKEAERGDVYYVSEDFFRVLGVAPRIGRPFSDAEQRPGGTPVAIVSDEFWRHALGGRDIGTAASSQTTLTTEGTVATVIGVMPAGFAYPSGAAVWLPVNVISEKGTRTAHNFVVIGRIANGQTIGSVRADMGTIATRLKAAYGSQENAEPIQVLELRDDLVGPSRTPLQVLMGAVLLVLLIACANLANTLLASGTRRRREITVRAALGASRGRLIRQLLTENFVLALAGGIAALAVSAALLPTLLRLAPATLPRLDDVHVDMRASAFAMALTLLTAALFGLLPALQTARADLRDMLADAARGSSAPRTARMRALLITTQVAVAFVLLVGSGLLIKSLGAVLSQPLGFEATNILTMEIALPETTYESDASVVAFYDRLLEETRKLPGIQQAGIASSIALMGFANGGFAVTGGPSPFGNAIYRIADAGYFQTLRIPLLAGRLFNARDTPDVDDVAVVSRSLAARYWPGQSAIGQRLRPLGMDKYAAKWLTVIGVVGDVTAKRMTTAPYPEIYVSERQRPRRMHYGYLLVRTAVSPESQAAALTRTLRTIDPNVPPKFATFDDLIAANVGDRRFTMRLLSTFSALALLLTAIGIYGVMAYTVAQRTSEIGIRMALGATRTAIVQLVLRNAFRSVAIGLIAGGLGAWLLAGTIRSFLFNVRAADPVVAVAALIALLAAAIVAVSVPAWRAARVDPQVSMRME